MHALEDMQQIPRVPSYNKGGDWDDDQDPDVKMHLSEMETVEAEDKEADGDSYGEATQRRQRRGCIGLGPHEEQLTDNEAARITYDSFVR